MLLNKPEDKNPNPFMDINIDETNNPFSDPFSILPGNSQGSIISNTDTSNENLDDMGNPTPDGKPHCWHCSNTGRSKGQQHQCNYCGRKYLDMKNKNNIKRESEIDTLSSHIYVPKIYQNNIWTKDNFIKDINNNNNDKDIISTKEVLYEINKLTEFMESQVNKIKNTDDNSELPVTGVHLITYSIPTENQSVILSRQQAKIWCYQMLRESYKRGFTITDELTTEQIPYLDPKTEFENINTDVMLIEVVGVEDPSQIRRLNILLSKRTENNKLTIVIDSTLRTLKQKGYPSHIFYRGMVSNMTEISYPMKQ